MKKMKLYIFITTILFAVTGLQAQVVSQNGIQPQQIEINRTAGFVNMDMNLNIERLNLSSQEMIILTPIVRSADNVNLQTFPPVVVTGSKRNKALNRALDFGSFEFETTPQAIYKDNVKTIPLHFNLPYNENLHNANLIFNEERIGCACKDEGTSEYPATRILPPMFYPKYTVAYVTPPVEEVKRRSETHSARLNFKVNRYEILENFKNNAVVLSEVDIIISALQSDSNLKVEEFQITGYASPEGNYQSNMTLSKNRAMSFVAYLSQKYGTSTTAIKTDWKGEDWDGLRKVVSELSIADRQNVLDIIDNELDIATRKNKLKQLSGGATYRMLLQDYYPPLRRNEYTVSYIARSFSIEEAKKQIKTRPQDLSLNEMFLVANSYPKNSEEFKEVFRTAARIYPNDPISQLNIAASSLEHEDANNVIARLERINMPEAWNNLGIAYIRKGEYERAKAYFQRASNAGLKTADYNADQLSQWLASQQ